MRSASRPLDQAPKRAAWCPSSIASRSQPARPGRAPGRCSRARHLTYGPRSKVVHAFRSAAERKRIRGRLEGKGDGLSSGARRRHLGPAIQGRAIWDQSRAGSKIASGIGTKGAGRVRSKGRAGCRRPARSPAAAVRHCARRGGSRRLGDAWPQRAHRRSRSGIKPHEFYRNQTRPERAWNHDLLRCQQAALRGRAENHLTLPQPSAGLEGGRGDTTIKVVVRQTSRF